MREYSINRETKETKIQLSLNLDGKGDANIDTGVGFLDHMLTLLAFHARMDLSLKCEGDLQVDSHHTVEDIGIALGIALKNALGEKRGIVRYGSFTIPMDEALVTVDLDLSGRSYLVYNAELPTAVLGNYETEMTEEFFRAFAYNSLMTLHINEHYGRNTHHIIEAMFKATGRALRKAVSIDEEFKDEVSSSKGVL
ncbi:MULTISPECIES: imidazoleglycerol-phosphate dehydratase HisB [Kandleria]|jgi:imidazoleglycerol-phosphate dehydratase|uniref:Imidazoleglycerol-phosphate dehydratase n=2 Tax=Kandleria vitulina TaxID=1630 RepID=A0A0R2HJB3_9FIRM|nr:MULTISPECIES: imidazoleglycerol-phosphate dehydratase HisB [Kandleria]KRN49847.1 imidazoleglycerol-phosphate dehydratase [Kandleria vitulina DSM 20405]MBP3276427.1 imidazoleglycerol-phosphate dehydratase HisB [Kandleria sp.]MEE0989218.1 imidazoleglycerol-phosphate dehydratase HisB [Kandleria vitulina]SDW74641.1 imidazoleglycerol-phosphate dehydratase [Kandleria vitulina]HAD22891.1 imidazoleglycerol-phosphate dehydratase HisB [Kandleria vitulina]